MNDTQYGNMLLKLMRKVPDSYKGYINTAPIDRAYGRNQVQRDLNYERLGTERDLNNRSLALGQRRLADNVERFNRNYGFTKDQISDAESQMGIANMIGAGGVGVNYLQGMNQRKANQKLTDLLDAQTAFYKSLA